MKKIVKRVLIGLMLFLVLGAAALLFGVYYLLNQPYKGYSEGKLAVKVEQGASVNRIARDFHQQGIIRHPLLLKGVFIFKKTQAQSKAGDYVFDRPLSPIQVYEKLMKGEQTYTVLTVVEGANKFDLEKVFQKEGLGTADDFRSALASSEVTRELKTIDPSLDSAEGFLFPETYFLSKHETPVKAVLIMLRHFKEFMGVEERQRTKELGMSLVEVVTLASLIEKETGQESERPLISGVFHNRLKKSMLLQCDPTIIYALMIDGRWRGEIYRSDIQYASPYNTYVSPGLPPGPICNPGADSLKAALYPQNTEMLYFVSKNDGTHYFSKTVQDHNRAVQMYQRN